eukprot:5146755-Prymnesium_polylepis.1
MRAGSCVVAVLCAARLSLSLDSPQVCPFNAAGTNVIVYPGGFESVISQNLPDLPAATITSNYGPTSMCGFDGTIVVGGPLSLRLGASFYSYSTMIRQSLSIFLDWLNGDRGGVQFGGKKYAMRFTWIDDASSKYQVANATAHATRGSSADFAFGGYASGLTIYAAKQSAADG